MAQITINSASITTMGGGPTNIQATDTQGATNDEVQQVLVWVDNATGGIFRLVFRGEATAALDYDATAAELDSALESLAGIDEVTVSGSAGEPWTVTFVGNHSDQNVEALVGDASALEAGTVVRTIEYSLDSADPVFIHGGLDGCRLLIEYEYEYRSAEYEYEYEYEYS